MKKVLIALVIVVGAFFIIDKVRAPHSEEENTSDTILIGAVNPLTGEATPYGDMMVNVTNMILNNVNATGGINGKTVKVLWEDGKCTGKDAAQAAQKLINVDKVKIVFGSCSTEVLGMAPITENRKIILYSTIATNPTIRDSGDFVFRSTPSDSSQGKILAEYANKHYSKVGLISEQTDYAIGVSNTFVEHFNGDIVREDFLSTESDFKTRITKLKNEDVDALFLSPQTPTKFEILTKQLQEQNWDKPIFANDAATGMIDVAKKYSDFFKKTTLVGANFIAPPGPALDTFLEEYRTTYNEEPTYISYAASTYDGIHMLLQALSKVEDTNNTQQIRDALYDIKDFNGLLGNISVDRNGEVNVTHSLFQFDGENFVPLQNQPEE